MELLAIVHVLWERRVVVALGVVAAIAVGLLAGRASGGASPGGGGSVAFTELMLDTTDSQLVEAAPLAAATLPTRAFLLANALGTDSSSAMVARAAGVPKDQLVVLPPSATMEPAAGTPLVTHVAAAVPVAATRYVVTVRADEVTPLISIESQASDPSEARRLANAAVAGVRSLLVTQDGSLSRGFVLHTAVPLRVTRVTGGSPHRRLILIAAAMTATFAGWCGCIVVVVGIARRLRPLNRAASRRLDC